MATARSSIAALMDPFIATIIEKRTKKQTAAQALNRDVKFTLRQGHLPKPPYPRGHGQYLRNLDVNSALYDPKTRAIFRAIRSAPPTPRGLRSSMVRQSSNLIRTMALCLEVMALCLELQPRCRPVGGVQGPPVRRGPATFCTGWCPLPPMLPASAPLL
eukprot:CAMPEP_0175995356 /NCGR_PEP_ID=MMETSP0108-20121206/55084_1 /TAXON_ID=195067 ORGANISM="Goniomonas pacifica, Strain CCMP1869" /NCGR_SAMPLE_ID=MMETSP0108 /ASSEMBLY_ACC=CAM_ASM_000204 /LENGTH=158 /DNA_ID=CAMNT_0017327465 /DNA_START=200 /DNA_END=673 /DNA_ORIENTATION=-